MDYTNKVEIPGTISEIRTSERGTHFIMLKQINTYNGVDYERSFELLINQNRRDIIEKLAVGKKALFVGSLTIFKIKKYNIHKMIIDVNQMTLE
jgi:hypothetical protein